jgi:hypothetical protein
VRNLGITLEERVTQLERFVDELRRRSDASVRKKDWRRTVGMFDGDPIMKEIIEEGRRIREKDKRQADR